MAQIDALAQAKRGLTATQKKVDSRLLTEAKQRSGQAAAAGVGHVATGVNTDKQGMTAVDVLGNPKAVAPAVPAVGGRVIAASAAGNAVRASVPLSAVESLAGKAGVQHVGSPRRPCSPTRAAGSLRRPRPSSPRASPARSPRPRRGRRPPRRRQPGLDGQRGRQGARRRRPGIGPTEVRSALTGTAIDIEAPGYDRDTGFGIVMPERALRQTGATPQPLVTADDPVISTSTDGDQFLEPGESATVSVPVTNRGDGTATGVSVQVTTPTAGATVRPASRSYGNVKVDVTKTNTFTVSVPASFPLGATVGLNIRVSFAGALSSQSATKSITVAARSITSATSAEAPFTGTWRPETPLAALNGHSADGTWNLHVADEAGLDIGSVRAFTLHVSGFVG